MPGTTRDTVDALLAWHHRTFRIVDTAGIRRPGRVARSGQVESLSVILARRAIEQADVAVLVVDAVEGATDQDATIAGEAEKAGCGIIIAANKWDLMKGRGHGLLEGVRRQAAAAGEVPRLRADPAHLGADGRADAEAARDDRQGRRGARPRIPTAELNRFIAGGHRRASAREPRTTRSAHPVRRADGRRAADVRLLHERRDGVPLLLRTLSGEPAARVVRPHRDTDTDQSAKAIESLTALFNARGLRTPNRGSVAPGPALRRGKRRSRTARVSWESGSAAASRRRTSWRDRA